MLRCQYKGLAYLNLEVSSCGYVSFLYYISAFGHAIVSRWIFPKKYVPCKQYYPFAAYLDILVQDDGKMFILL